MTLETDRSWPRNTWYLAAWSSELHDGPLARTVLNEHIVLYRDQNGTIAALEDRCCHCAAPLSMGRIVPKGLQCGYHGLTFGGDGKCVSIPGQDSIPPQARVKSYPVVARGEFVWIWMGNPEIADPQQLARFPPYDENKRGTHMHGMVPIKCNYMLLVDNLMDLTHILFVHRSSIGGGGEMELVNADVDVKRTELGLRYIRWMLGHTPPPIYITALCLGDGAKVDRWQEFEYVAPGSVLQWTGGMEVGRGARENREQNGSLSVRLYHGVTPETENSCFYFWMRANSQDDDSSATAAYYKQFIAIIAEDVAILEGQNTRIAEEAGRPLLDIKNDAIRVMARRAVERMIRDENKQAALTR